MNILVLCYCISPTRGSEYSVAWNYVTNMSREHRLTVLYGASGDHMGDVEEMEEYLKHQTVPNVSFRQVKTTGMMNLLNLPNRKGVFKYTFYAAYRLWHFSAYRMAAELCKTEKFDLIHYLSPIGYREPGYLWKLDLPYMWGPIGGFNQYPPAMFDCLRLRDKLKFGFRNFANFCQLRLSLRVKRAMLRSNKLIVATTQMQKVAESVFHRSFDYLPENGLTAPLHLDEARFKGLEEGRIRLIAIGSLDGRKNFTVPVLALGRAIHKKEFSLDIIGEGPMRGPLQKIIDDCSLSGNVTIHGSVSRQKVFEMLRSSHLNIISSLGEANTTVILEAFQCGVPTITVDHCGMHDSVNESNGYKYAVNDCNGMVAEFASILDHIATNRSEIIDKSRNALNLDEKFIWGQSRRTFFDECYRQCILDFNGNPK